MTRAPAEAGEEDFGGWDVHAHLVPPSIFVAAEQGRFAMEAAGEMLQVCGHGVPLHPISEINRLLDRLALDRLAGAVVSVPPPLFRPDLGEADRRDYASFVNEALLEACRCDDEKLRPLAYLPAEDPELAVDIAATLGSPWAGVVMGTDLGNASYADAAYDELWSTLVARRLPLFIHPGSSPDPRLRPFYLSNLLGNPVETTLAAAQLLFGGVLQRHRDLKVILAHGGGCIAALGGRWQRGAMTERPGIPKMELDPLSALRRFYVDSLVHSPPCLSAIIELVGEEHVLLGSDWPFPMGAPSANHDLGCLARPLRHRIRVRNAQEAFGERLVVQTKG